MKAKMCFRKYETVKFCQQNIQDICGIVRQRGIVSLQN
jgi:hypothetical protein